MRIKWANNNNNNTTEAKTASPLAFYFFFRPFSLPTESTTTVPVRFRVVNYCSKEISLFIFDIVYMAQWRCWTTKTTTMFNKERFFNKCSTCFG